MNIIEVTGGNKFQRAIAEKVVHEMISALLPRFRTLEIEVKIKKLTGDAVGWCLGMVPEPKEAQGKLRGRKWIGEASECVSSAWDTSMERNMVHSFALDAFCFSLIVGLYCHRSSPVFVIH